MENKDLCAQTKKYIYSYFSLTLSFSHYMIKNVKLNERFKILLRRIAKKIYELTQRHLFNLVILYIKKKHT